MTNISKCLLLPIDGTEEALLPIRFISRLFPKLDQVDLILGYFFPPLPPVYQKRQTIRGMAEKKKELIRAREQNARAALDRARQALLRSGFADELIQEHVQQKAMSVAHHACQLADVRKVDAVLVPKRISNPLEGFLKGDPSNALLHHCIVSPVWFTEGDIDPSRAAVCIQNEAASIRAVDHAAFMLAETETEIDLLHVTPSASSRITSSGFDPSRELTEWFTTAADKEIQPLISDSCEILKLAGISSDRIRVVILPGREKEGKVASEILTYTSQAGTGIVVLGHSNPEGVWSFLKTSVTKKILGDFQNMAVWVNQ